MIEHPFKQMDSIIYQLPEKPSDLDNSTHISGKRDSRQKAKSQYYMKQSNEMFNGLVGQASKSLLDSFNEKNNAAQMRLFLAIIGILAFVGAEVVKVIFRRNFGKEGISLLRIIISFVCFIVLSGLLLSDVFGDDIFGEKFGSKASFIFSSLLYLSLAIYVLAVGIKEWHIAVKLDPKKLPKGYKVFPEDYKGTSTLLGFLLAEKWKQSTIQNFIEPISVIMVAIGLSFINPVAGLPLAFCAISVWLYQIAEYVFGIDNYVDGVLKNQGHRTETKQAPRFGHVIR